MFFIHVKREVERLLMTFCNFERLIEFDTEYKNLCIQKKTWYLASSVKSKTCWDLLAF